MTSARWQVLGAISLAGSPVTVPTIARAMGLTRQAVQKQVDQLRADGLAEFQDNPAHRGSPLVALTEAGGAAYDHAETRWSLRARELGEALAPNEVTAALNVVERLSRLLRDEE